MGKVNCLRNRFEPLAALLWALGIVLDNTWPCPPDCHCSTAIHKAWLIWSSLVQFSTKTYCPPTFSYLCMLFIYGWKWRHRTWLGWLTWWPWPVCACDWPGTWAACSCQGTWAACCCPGTGAACCCCPPPPSCPQPFGLLSPGGWDSAHREHPLESP